MRHRGMGIVLLGCAALVALLAACVSPRPSATPITSAGDPAAAVPFRWALQADSAGGGGTLRLQGGTLHAIADEVRLLDAAGKATANSPATPIGAGERGLCGEPQAQGVVRAELRLPDASAWPGQYRIEVKVGGTWRPAQLTKAC